jgi:hypothetical protein
VVTRGARDDNPMNMLCELVYGADAAGDGSDAAGGEGDSSEAVAAAALQRASSGIVEDLSAMFQAQTLLTLAQFHLVSGTSFHAEGGACLYSPTGTPSLVSLRHVSISRGCWYFSAAVVVPGGGGVGVLCGGDSVDDGWFLLQGGSGVAVRHGASPHMPLVDAASGATLDKLRAGDVVCVSVDADSGSVTFAVSSRRPTGAPSLAPRMFVAVAAGARPPFVPAFVLQDSLQLYTNFGNEPFAVPPPHGYLSMRRCGVGPARVVVVSMRVGMCGRAFLVFSLVPSTANRVGAPDCLCVCVRVCVFVCVCVYVCVRAVPRCLVTAWSCCVR